MFGILLPEAGGHVGYAPVGLELGKSVGRCSVLGWRIPDREAQTWWKIWPG